MAVRQTDGWTRAFKLKLLGRRTGRQRSGSATSYLVMIFFSAWWRHQMGTFSALLAICAGNSPVPGELPAQRPATRSFDVFFDLRLNKRLSKQSWGWWFETLSRSLWRHCNGRVRFLVVITHECSISSSALWMHICRSPCLHCGCALTTSTVSMSKMGVNRKSWLCIYKQINTERVNMAQW